MKCRLLRDELITHPDLKSFDDLKALQHELLSGKIGTEEYDRRRRITAKAGSVIEHPFAWQLVAMGMAEPVDQECVNRAAMVMPGALSLDEKIVNAVEGLQRMEDAQLTGDPAHDASPEEVEKMRAKRAERLAKSNG